MAVLKRPPLVVHAGSLQEPATSACHVGGPLCTPVDELPGPLQLPEVRRGDLLAVLNVGAYGLTFSPQQFLSHPTPAEVLVDRGVARLVRQRGSFADALLRQQPF
jgi:diaminopimelate decarboxylase